MVHRGLSWKPCYHLKKEKMGSRREKKANTIAYDTLTFYWFTAVLIIGLDSDLSVLTLWLVT